MRVLKMELENCFCFKKNTIPPSGEFGIVNCFIGENDRGKSLALKILDMAFNSYNSTVFEGIKTSGGEMNVSLNLNGRKLLYGDTNSTGKITIYLEIDDINQFKNILNYLQSKFADIDSYKNVKLEYKIEFPNEGDGRFWLDKIYFGSFEKRLIDLDQKESVLDLDKEGSIFNDFKQILSKMFSDNGFLLIPAIRSINREIVRGVVEPGWSPEPNGTGLANAIFEFKNTPRLGKRPLMRQVEEDVKKLTEFDSVSALVDQNQRDVEFNEIPKSFVGDATKQITVSIFNIRSFGNKKIIGFEEPESHLDPGRQKKYLKYLLELCNKNKTQLFITTHSPFLINMFEIENIYHFKKDEHRNIKIDCCTSDDDLWMLLNMIGVKPSDLLQSDLIIFTEGPSDKYILEIFAEKIGYDLRKYNVCLTYLGSINRDFDVETLLRINRNFRLVRDSNKGDIGEIRNTVRITELFKKARKKSHLKVWNKREIENYLSPRAIEEYFRLPKNTLQININTDVEMEINKKLEENKIHKKYNKIKDGIKIAQMMRRDEIDAEIDKFLKDAISTLKSN